MLLPDMVFMLVEASADFRVIFYASSIQVFDGAMQRLDTECFHYLETHPAIRHRGETARGVKNLYSVVLVASAETENIYRSQIMYLLMRHILLNVCDKVRRNYIRYQEEGEDQKQHVELTRNIAKRFNGIYGDVFKLPEPYIPKVGARIMSLANPEAKMSKSENDDPGRVCLMDKPEDIMRLFKRAITDCESEVRYDPEHKKGVSNLMTIYSAATGRTFAEIETEFAGRGYGDFKKTVGEAVVELLRPIREESQRLLADKAYLQSVCESGAQKAACVAEKTLRKVYKKVGFVAR